MATTAHDEPQHTIEQGSTPAPSQSYYDDPLRYNWDRSSKVGTVTGAGLGAAAGAAMGAAGFFIGAVPGAFLGAIAGAIAGGAAGAAADAVAASFETGV